MALSFRVKKSLTSFSSSSSSSLGSFWIFKGGLWHFYHDREGILISWISRLDALASLGSAYWIFVPYLIEACDCNGELISFFITILVWVLILLTNKFSLDFIGYAWAMLFVDIFIPQALEEELEPDIVFIRNFSITGCSSYMLNPLFSWCIYWDPLSCPRLSDLFLF